MNATLEKVRRLEQYVATSESAVDPVLDMAVDKLLERESARLFALKSRLTEQLAELEIRYGMKSVDFYARYERGEMGDDTDFVEWSATVEMLENANKRLAVLEESTPG